MEKQLNKISTAEIKKDMNEDTMTTVNAVNSWKRWQVMTKTSWTALTT